MASRRISPITPGGVRKAAPPRSVVRGPVASGPTSLTATVSSFFAAKDIQQQLVAIVVREATRRCARVESRAKVLVSGPLVNVDTGRLRSSIRSVIGINRTGGTLNVVGRTGTNVKYARYLHGGTGIYGPRRQRIRPRTATVLAWRGRDGRMVFRASVAGIRPRPFLRQALRDTNGGLHP